MVVTCSEYEKKYILTPSRKELGRTLGRNSSRRFVEHVFDNTSTKKQTILKFIRVLQSEMKKLYHLPAFIGDSYDLTGLLGLSWDGLCESLYNTTPVLVGFLKACIPSTCPRKQSILVACIGLLVNSHQKPTVIQKLVSIFLYSGHSGKQVIMVMNRIFCVFVYCYTLA